MGIAPQHFGSGGDRPHQEGAYAPKTLTDYDVSDNEIKGNIERSVYSTVKTTAPLNKHCKNSLIMQIRYMGALWGRQASLGRFGGLILKFWVSSIHKRKY